MSEQPTPTPDETVVIIAIEDCLLRAMIHFGFMDSGGDEARILLATTLEEAEQHIAGGRSEKGVLITSHRFTGHEEGGLALARAFHKIIPRGVVWLYTDSAENLLLLQYAEEHPGAFIAVQPIVDGKCTPDFMEMIEALFDTVCADDED